MSNSKEKALKILKAIGRWFASRWVGFYLLIPVEIATFIYAFVYGGEFMGGFYGSTAVMTLTIITLLAFVLACFRPTARFAPIVMFATQLITLGIFIETSYMYLSSPFFNGIQGNVLVQAGFPYSYCVLCSVLCIIITAVAACFRQYKNQKKSFFGTPEYAVKKSGEEVVGE